MCYWTGQHVHLTFTDKTGHWLGLPIVLYYHIMAETKTGQVGGFRLNGA